MIHFNLNRNQAWILWKLMYSGRRSELFEALQMIGFDVYGDEFNAAEQAPFLLQEMAKQMLAKDVNNV